jgi:Fic family protein
VKPPYEITPLILHLISDVSNKIGALQGNVLVRESPKLRKQNQIKTIHASLKIEGNTLSEEQVTAVLENKRVLGPEKDIKEVVNALAVYQQLKNYSYKSEKDFLKAHQLLMQGLVESPGKYRTKGVGIVKGKQVAHMAPPYQQVKPLMGNLFRYLNDKKELALIKSCVFHYEMEFIHPFMDGNGRMGRLWQTMILMHHYQLFEFLPFETLIAKNQRKYYQALAASDKAGKSTPFIEFMLGIINQSLADLLQHQTQRLNDTERLVLYLEQQPEAFTRKDYMSFYKELSTATASRDLKNGTISGLLKKHGDKKNTYYLKGNMV